MNIKLTSEQRKVIEDKLVSGRYRTALEVITEALQALQEKERSAPRDDGKQREAVREMLAFVGQNRTRLSGLSVRDLIHEGRRL